MAPPFRRGDMVWSYFPFAETPDAPARIRHDPVEPSSRGTKIGKLICDQFQPPTPKSIIPPLFCASPHHHVRAVFIIGSRYWPTRRMPWRSLPSGYFDRGR